MRYTAEQLAFIEAGYRQWMVPELAERFNQKFDTKKSAAAIKATISNHKFRCGRSVGNPEGTYLLLSREQAEFVREHYKNKNCNELAAALNAEFNINLSPAQIKTFTTNHKMLSGRTGCFLPGSKPWNAGTKGAVKPNGGSFKKGDIPKNSKALWAERICTKDGYILMKVPERNPYTGAPTRFKAKHVWMWEQAYGSIPDKHCLAFIDGNKLNCVLNNIMLLSMAQRLHLTRLGYWTAEPEIKPSILLLAKLQVRLFEKNRAELVATD